MTPDLILTNASICTMDPARPEARAIAVRDGIIVALGSDADIRALSGPATQVVDAGGRRVLPGFQDAHVHLLSGGTDLVTSAPLHDVTTLPDLLSALAAHAARNPDLPVVFGAGWQPGLFGDHNLTAAVLDAVLPDRPCLIYDSSFHNACLNGAALVRAGIGDDTSDPPNGHLVRDARGRVTGMLHEDAVPWALARLPPIPAATYLAGLRAGQAHANAHGITGIIDPSLEPEYAAAYATLAAAGGLTLRVAGAPKVLPGDSVAAVLDRLTALRRAHPRGDFVVNAAKLFIDGVFENRTAACLAPYADAGGNAPPMFCARHLAELVTTLDAARFQIHAHVIGDAALRVTLDALAAARGANGDWPALPQLAHVQLADVQDIPRIAALGAMANVQPLWAQYDPVVPDIALDMIGPARLPQVYAFRQMLDAGAAMCLSSDWPVSTLNPFEIIETAVTRQPRRDEGQMPVFLPAECLTVAEAVRGYTVEAARACWREGVTGRLVAGYSADLIVLDRDILTVPAQEIGEAKVLLTLFKGRSVHAAHPFGDLQ